MVSCFVWIHSDSDLLGFCSISHSCNVMGCESQGQFVSTCVFVFFSFFVYLSCLLVFLCVYKHICIEFSLCLPLPVCLFVCLCTCVCVRLAEVDEKSSVWQGSHCGRCSVYTSLWHGLCVKHTVLLWPYKQQHTHTRTHTLLCSFHFHIIHHCKNLL